MGNACWELFCLEHGIDRSGKFSKKMKVGGRLDSQHTFFNEIEGGRLIPRAIFVDLDPTTIGEPINLFMNAIIVTSYSLLVCDVMS